MAKETVKIVEDGYYELPDHQSNDLRQAIDETLAKTELIRPDAFASLVVPESSNFETSFEVRNETTLAAAERLVVQRRLDSVLCLNFASAKNPGGGYLGGSQAQEESLARSSALVKTLESKWEYYEVNRSCNTAFYTNHTILSPSVPVFRADDGTLLDEPYLLSIVTAPAVNAGAVLKNEPNRASQIEPVMAERIEKLLKLAAAKGYEHLILGAWGCGVFRNDPAVIARLFAEALLSGGVYEHRFASVTFTVLDGTDNERIIGPFRAQFQ